MKRVVALSAALLATIGFCWSRVGITQAQSPVRQGFDLQVPISPAPVRIEESDRLLYELHVTNFANEGLMPTRVQALDMATGAVLGDFQGSALRQRIGGPGEPTEETIASGARAVIYLDVPMEERTRALIHRVEYRAAEGSSEPPITGGAAYIDERTLPVLGPPLRGGPWVAVYDPSMERGHRRVVYAVDGRARIPGRFAIDWMKPRGQAEDSAAPAPDGHGAEVLAVADAVVAATRDDVPEPSSAGASPVKLGDAAGNYIALDLGHGRYAFYEHLKPGLLVKPGDRVEKGQVIASLGSTGQATRPHLHFHVSDAASPLPAEGQPYLLSDFTVLGAYDSIGAFSRGEPWALSAAKAVSGPSFPPPNVVVRFPDG